MTQQDSVALADKVAIVTGASSGIGLSIVRLLAERGVRVHAMARRYQAMADGAGEERIQNGRVVPHAVDVTDQPAVGKLVEEVGAGEGIDILVCAAGTNVPRRRLEDMDPKTWDSMIAVNLHGTYYALHAALPYLRASRGSVVLISSASAAWPDVSGAAYQAAKSGVVALGRAAAIEEHERGVRISTILPGQVDTPLLDQRPAPPPREIRDASIQPEDVADACLFLLTLPPRVYVPEMTMLPTLLQALGRTSTDRLVAKDRNMTSPE